MLTKIKIKRKAYQPMSLKKDDLKDLIGFKLHIDEYESKMGKDEDIVTISFKSKYKDPAKDLVNYLEKGYEWVLDADVSAGAVSDGSWVVFIEAARRPSLAKNILSLIDDMKSLTNNDPSEYTFKYKKDRDYTPLTIDNFNDKVPNSPREYRRRNKSQELGAMLNAAGVKAERQPPVIDPELAEFVNLSKR